MEKKRPCPDTTGGKAALVGIEAPDDLKHVLLDPATKESWFMGRSQDADLTLPSVNVSRRHATITYRKESAEWTIKDHKSLNGVYVNENRIDAEVEFALSDGDKIGVGPPGNGFKWTFSSAPSQDECEGRTPEKKKSRRFSGEAPLSEKCEPKEDNTRIEYSKDGEEEESADEKVCESQSTSVINKLRTKFNEELSCTICNEVFIAPMTLPCGHVFCSFCLAQWRKKCFSGHYDCPNCRHKIGKEKVTPNLYLENLITSWTKELGPDMLQERERAVTLRKGEEAEEMAAENKKKAAREAQRLSRGRHGGRGRGRGIESFFEVRGRSNAEDVAGPSSSPPAPMSSPRTRAMTAATAATARRTRAEGSLSSRRVPRVLLDELVTVTLSSSTSSSSSDDSSSSSSSDSSSDSDSSSNEVPGTGAFYGGYGRCFRCGQSGHWAPGCPY